MVQTHDIFLRALAVAPDKKKRKSTYRQSAPAADHSKWSNLALVFDTESRITADQSLTFGVYQLCELVNDNYVLVEEGVFYADGLSPKARIVLKNYARTAVSDVASFPPRFRFSLGPRCPKILITSERHEAGRTTWSCECGRRKQRRTERTTTFSMRRKWYFPKSVPLKDIVERTCFAVKPKAMSSCLC